MHPFASTMKRLKSSMSLFVFNLSFVLQLTAIYVGTAGVADNAKPAPFFELLLTIHAP